MPLDDLYMQYGTPCSEEGYCYNGTCSDCSVHCREIFGRDSFQGHDDCYELNRGANRFGHCTTMHRVLKFNGCKKEDVKYGRLQCSNITQLPPLQEEVSFHQPKISGVWCWGLSNHYRLDVIVDVGQIRNGALLRRSVLTTAAILVSNDCPPNKCNFRRLCNNHGECFCHIGWKPPMCWSRGAGGSIPDGPASTGFGQIGSIKTSQKPLQYLQLIFDCIYAFIAALLFGVATNVKSIQTSTVKEVTVKGT